MNPIQSTVLVTGITGNQGGAVARSLVAEGFRVRGLTRSPEKPAARAHAARGVEIVRGDLDNRESVERALEGCYGVFSVQNFMETGAEREVEQGVHLADAARRAGVKHLVYTSVASANKNTGLPHFESKWRIEEHIRSIGVPYSILRPVFFMQNWRAFSRDDILHGVLRQPLDPDTTLQQISVNDIGVFAAKAFANPKKWIGRELDLAGDELSMWDVALTFRRVLGHAVSYVKVPWDQFRQLAGDEMTAMYRWFNAVGYDVDIGSLRAEHPGLERLEDVLWAEEWRGTVAASERRAA